MFHGCVDGFSHTIIYLECLNNNRASSVLSLFQEGVQNIGMPSRVRCDRGMENTEVARYMLRQRGLNRSSIITGRSVHNQCIERLWAELNRVVSYHYSDLFTFMQNEGILDSLSELHMFSLHYIYFQRIQRAVGEFRDQWINHALSTKRHMTPLQLWHRGVITHVGQNSTAVSSVFDANEPSVTDESGPLSELHLNNNVEVPENNFNINDTTIEEINQAIDPFTEDGNHGMNLFVTLVNFLETKQFE